MNRAEVIVDALLEGWLKDKWQDFKVLTGLGHDEYGMGKNTEKGWKPSWQRGRQPAPKARPLKVHRPQHQGPGEKVWDLDVG